MEYCEQKSTYSIIKRQAECFMTNPFSFRKLSRFSVRMAKTLSRYVNVKGIKPLAHKANNYFIENLSGYPDFHVRSPISPR